MVTPKIQSFHQPGKRVLNRPREGVVTVAYVEHLLDPTAQVQVAPAKFSIEDHEAASCSFDAGEALLLEDAICERVVALDGGLLVPPLLHDGHEGVHRVAGALDAVVRGNGLPVGGGNSEDGGNVLVVVWLCPVHATLKMVGRSS